MSAGACAKNFDMISPVAIYLAAIGRAAMWESGCAERFVLMMRRRVLIMASIFAAYVAPAIAACPGKFAVEVLGSGGPLADDARASSSYLVWIEGKARLLVDAGGGAFVRFGESGADMTTLNAVLVSHFHADHVSDLAALLKSASFDKKEER
ncbi:MAG: MBL fold metallo-hydrolase [Rhodomicrobium sp.]|nr:MBL fold metallo-hydrolase [Rhodomicrobium sp.]